MEEILQARKKRLQKIHKKKDYHAWLITSIEYKDIHTSLYYKNVITNKMVIAHIITEDSNNPFLKHVKAEYQGIVHEYKGRCVHKANVIPFFEPIQKDIYF